MQEAVETDLLIPIIAHYWRGSSSSDYMKLYPILIPKVFLFNSSRQKYCVR